MEEGAAHAEAALGRPLGPGGRHARMGTHNRLLGLGDCYLEAIAVDPDGPDPDRPRWYALDGRRGAPALDHWALRVDDLDAAVAALPSLGEPIAFERDGLRWRMAVPPDGRLPFASCAPAVIEWETAPPSLPESGFHLIRLTLRHPAADDLRAVLARLTEDPRIVIEAGGPGIEAAIDGPDGTRTLR